MSVRGGALRSENGFTLIELLIVVAIIGIIAAIAIPSLLRARVSANESATLGDIRTVMSSEVLYHSANSGFYGQLTCLSTPSNANCIPGYGTSSPSFIDSQLATATVKSGYNRTATYAGTGPDAGDATTYCYQASPMTANTTGVRSFGGDTTGVIGANTGATAACCVGGSLNTTICPGIR